jgi:hypothetical protein
VGAHQLGRSGARHIGISTLVHDAGYRLVWLDPDTVVCEGCALRTPKMQPISVPYQGDLYRTIHGAAVGWCPSSGDSAQRHRALQA